MAGIQIGGIVSGMDTNALVDQLVQQAKVPLNNLSSKYSKVELEKTVYKEVNSKLDDIEKTLLSLRLESTFNTKNTTVSDESVLGAYAGLTAKTGTYTVTTQQMAQTSTWSSHYTMQALIEDNVNLKSVTGVPDDNIEGTHEFTVDTANWVTTDKFTPEELGQFSKLTGETYMYDTGSAGPMVNDYGNLAVDVSGTLTIDIDDGTSITINTSAVSGDDVNILSRDIEQQINDAINANKNTTDVTYVSVRADYNSAAAAGQKWSLAMYDMTVSDLNLKVTGGTLQTDLGFTGTGTETLVTSMSQYHVGVDESDLLSKMSDPDGGIIPGTTLTLDKDASLAAGTFKIVQSSGLKVGGDSYTTITGNTASDGSGISLNTAGLHNSGFDRTVSSSTNGTFTINGVEIEIEDYSTMTVNELIGKINASGAGVTMSYDSVNDAFVIKNNDSGSTNITLGDFGDTSDIISVMKLSTTAGATKVYGTSDTSIDPTVALASAGLSRSITTGTFSINGVSIYVDAATDTMEDIIAKVNKSGAGVTMSYDETRDKVNLVSNTIERINIGSADDTSSLLVAFNLTNDTTSAQDLGTAGQYAKVTVNGVQYVRKTNEIDDIVEGLNISLRSEGETATISVNIDTDRAVKAVAEYVSAYNSIMDMFSVSALPDDNADEYINALSDDEKAEMDSDSIATYEANWEKYNREAIIRSSPEVRSLKQAIRGSMFAELLGINGNISNLAELGIEVAGDGDITEEAKGYLVEFTDDIDEIVDLLNGNSTFMDNIRNNTESVFKFFSQTDEDALGWSKSVDNVIARYTDLDGMIGGKIKTNGSLDKQMLSLATQMETQQLRIESQLERLWSQFTAMEQKIAEAQDMGSQLSSLTGS